MKCEGFPGSEVSEVAQPCPTAIPWTVVYQASLSMGFSRQGYWSGLPFLSPGDLPDPGIKPRSPALQVDALPSEPPGKPLKHRRHTNTVLSQSLWGLWDLVHTGLV